MKACEEKGGFTQACGRKGSWSGTVLTMATGTLLYFHLLIVRQPRRRKKKSTVGKNVYAGQNHSHHVNENQKED